MRIKKGLDRGQWLAVATPEEKSPREKNIHNVLLQYVICINVDAL